MLNYSALLHMQFIRQNKEPYLSNKAKQNNFVCRKLNENDQMDSWIGPLNATQISWANGLQRPLTA